MEIGHVAGDIFIEHNFLNTHLRRVSSINSPSVHSKKYPICFINNIFQFGAQQKFDQKYSQVTKIQGFLCQSTIFTKI